MYDTLDRISLELPTPAGAVGMLCDTIKITRDKIKTTVDNSGGKVADPGKCQDRKADNQYSDPALLKRDAETFHKTVADGTQQLSSALLLM